MPRKPVTLEGERAEIKRRYKKHDPVVRGRVTDDAEMLADDRVWARAKCAMLKASDHSHSYIAEACCVSRDVVSKWLRDPEVQASVAELREDQLKGGVKYLRTYAIEFIEMLAVIARTADSDETRLRAIQDGLDRIGLTKINKSARPVDPEGERDPVDEEKETQAAMQALLKASPADIIGMAGKLADVASVAQEHKA